MPLCRYTNLLVTGASPNDLVPHRLQLTLVLDSAPIGRATLGRELATLEDYRGRLSQYRTDVSLVAAHQNAPWITVWSVVTPIRCIATI